MIPVDGFKVRPLGRLLALKAYGALPPLALKVVLYALPTVKAPSVAGVITSVGAVTVIVTVAGLEVPAALVAV
jgi:hypothetical protein